VPQGTMGFIEPFPSLPKRFGGNGGKKKKKKKRKAEGPMFMTPSQSISRARRRKREKGEEGVPISPTFFRRVRLPKKGQEPVVLGRGEREKKGGRGKQEMFIGIPY